MDGLAVFKLCCEGSANCYYSCQTYIFTKIPYSNNRCENVISIVKKYRILFIRLDGGWRKT